MTERFQRKKTSIDNAWRKAIAAIERGCSIEQAIRLSAIKRSTFHSRAKRVLHDADIVVGRRDKHPLQNIGARVCRKPF